MCIRDRYSIIRTVTAVERCDVAVLIIDATEGITEQDVDFVLTTTEVIRMIKEAGIDLAQMPWEAMDLSLIHIFIV